jgi:hypothetical protein
MIELLSLLFGGLLRLAPEVLKLVNAGKDQAHELQMTRLQLDIDKARADQQIDLVHAQGKVAENAAEMAAMLEALRGQGNPTGVPWIDAISASVRPVLTYWWCLCLYSGYKAITVGVAIAAGMKMGDLALLLITEFDRNVIASMISFWFVDRAMRHGGRLS